MSLESNVRWFAIGHKLMDHSAKFRLVRRNLVLFFKVSSLFKILLQFLKLNNCLCTIYLWHFQNYSRSKTLCVLNTPAQSFGLESTSCSFYLLQLEVIPTSTAASGQLKASPIPWRLNPTESITIGFTYAEQVLKGKQEHGYVRNQKAATEVSVYR